MEKPECIFSQASLNRLAARRTLYRRAHTQASRSRHTHSRVEHRKRETALVYRRFCEPRRYSCSRPLLLPSCLLYPRTVVRMVSFGKVTSRLASRMQSEKPRTNSSRSPHSTPDSVSSFSRCFSATRERERKRSKGKQNQRSPQNGSTLTHGMATTSIYFSCSCRNHFVGHQPRRQQQEQQKHHCCCCCCQQLPTDRPSVVFATGHPRVYSRHYPCLSFKYGCCCPLIAHSRWAMNGATDLDTRQMCVPSTSI